MEALNVIKELAIVIFTLVKIVKEAQAILFKKAPKKKN